MFHDTIRLDDDTDRAKIFLCLELIRQNGSFSSWLAPQEGAQYQISIAATAAAASIRIVDSLVLLLVLLLLVQLFTMGRRIRRLRQKIKERRERLHGNKDRLLEVFGDDKPKCLTADIMMISGCEDNQTSADVSNVA